MRMTKMLYVLCLVSIALSVVIDLITGGASILPGLVFWISLPQGLLALAAGAELSQGRWILPIKNHLMKFYPLLLVSPVMLLYFGLRHLDLYGWFQHPTAWLQPDFLVLRNVFLQILTFLLAWLLVKAVQKGSGRTGTLATLYCFCFVVGQTVIGLDFFMSMEFPLDQHSICRLLLY